MKIFNKILSIGFNTISFIEFKFDKHFLVKDVPMSKIVSHQK